jgi:predicted membrane channel-forming protein YqfA (hemolysin III family)
MNRVLGGLFLLVGLIGVVYYGTLFVQNSESFNFFGADVVISSGDYAPVLISAIILVVGIFIYQVKRPSKLI